MGSKSNGTSCPWKSKVENEIVIDSYLKNLDDNFNNYSLRSS